jgi:NADPH:quinone reductase-like Zn-dependent oxidoreductase
MSTPGRKRATSSSRWHIPKRAALFKQSWRIRLHAIVYTHYGSPEVLQLQAVEKPTPKDNQVLVKVYAASANPLDWHRMRGAPFLARVDGGLRKPNNPRLGADVAERVEVVGSSVTQFQPGDAVFGCVTGAFAEYVCGHETGFALKPTNLSFEQAASVPVVAFTARQGLRDTGQIQPRANGAH